MERIDLNSEKKITVKEEDINHYTCPICLNLLIEPVKTECKHTFCYVCLEELMENTSSETEFKCPMCRQSFSKNFNLKIEKSIESLIKSAFSSEFTKRELLLKEYKTSQGNFVKIKILYGNSHSLVENPKKSKKMPDAEIKHSWCCFVKMAGNESSKYIRKIIFGLHPSFGTTEVEVKSAPFEIKRKGWGYFEIPVKIYFHPAVKISKPLELTHMLNFDGDGETKVHILKLDKQIFDKINGETYMKIKKPVSTNSLSKIIENNRTSSQPIRSTISNKTTTKK